jgi:Raf kinase inhibitor-like YbhB/YbcL family protein
MATTLTGLTLTSPAFREGAPIPTQYTCDGENRSPELAWSGALPNTRSYALILHDPDGTRGDFTHWVLFDIPANLTTIPGGGGMTRAGLTGRNDFGNLGYGGPCPPPGHGRHRYVFDLYALNTDALGLNEGASRADVEAAMQGRIITQTQLMGTYERKGGGQ